MFIGEPFPIKRQSGVKKSCILHSSDLLGTSPFHRGGTFPIKRNWAQSSTKIEWWTAPTEHDDVPGRKLLHSAIDGFVNIVSVIDWTVDNHSTSVAIVFFRVGGNRRRNVKRRSSFSRRATRRKRESWKSWKFDLVGGKCLPSIVENAS